MATLTPEGLQAMTFSIQETILNKKNLMTIDKQEMPFLSLLRKKMKTQPAKGGDYKVKYKESIDFNTDYWDGRDRLGFEDATTGFDLEFGWSRNHQGLELVHTEIEEIAGFTVEPNTKKTRAVGKKQPGVDGDILYNYVEDKLSEFFDSYDRTMDQAWLTSNGGDPKAPAGLHGLLPVTSNTAGTFGGKPRSNPLLQFQLESTTVAGLATSVITDPEAKLFLRQMKWMRREADKYSRMNSSGKIDVFMVGARWLDIYQEIIENKEYRYAGSLDSPITGANLGIHDTGLKYMGIPIFHNPTFEILDDAGIDVDSIAWTNRCYMLNTKALNFYNAPGKDKVFSVPADPYDQRISRFSLEGMYSMNLQNIRGFGVHYFK